MIRSILVTLLVQLGIQKAIFEYQSILVKGYSDFEKRHYVLVNTTDLSETVAQMVKDQHQIKITSDYQQNYLKMEIKDFLFRVFSQRFYLYELALDFQSDISVMTGWNILTQMLISKDGLDKLNSMATAYKLELQSNQIDRSLLGTNQMKCDRVQLNEANTDSNIVVELCNFVKQINRTDALLQDQNIYELSRQNKRQLRPDEY